jgi:NAD(P)-dependent dehydrogenase (short-subunit alcohol dehydrogenase family)
MNSEPFSLSNRVAVITGGYGVIGGCIASALSAAGARVAILGRRRDAADAKANDLRRSGGDAMVLVGDVLDGAEMRAARDTLLGAWGQIDILFNGAGGNVSRARNDNRPIFDVPLDAFDEVLRLNLHGTLIPSLVFGEAMATRGSGSIVNVSSMASYQALSGVLGYSVAKAGVDNLTRWLAVELARKHGAGVRVNAIAPGFFVSEQNRAVLMTPDGGHTERARSIIARTRSIVAGSIAMWPNAASSASTWPASASASSTRPS